MPRKGYNPTGKKASTKVHHERYLWIKKLRADMYTTKEILNNDVVLSWKVSKSTIQNYICDDIKEDEDFYSHNRDEIRKDGIIWRWKHTKRCLKRGDNRTALATQDSMAKITGLMNDTGNPVNIFNFQDMDRDDTQKMLDALNKK